jgi:LacI family transcriptional regulator
MIGMQRNATQKEVAKLAGVSRSVVSHVLHGGTGSIGVSEQTSERVRRAAAELNYRPSAIARILKGRQTKQIAVVHGDGYPRLHFQDGSGYFPQLMDGFVDAAFQRGYTLSLCPHLLSDDPNDAMADARFDGLLWYSTVPSEPNDERLQKCSLPVVIMHAHLSDFQGRYDTVACDNAGGIELAFNHLLDLGHRRISFALDSYYSFGEAQARLEAFLALGAKHRLNVTVTDVRNDSRGLEEAMSGKCRPTAFIGYNDELAIRVMSSLASLKIDVPEEVSIVGFDSTRLCELLRVPLTAVSQPIYWMADYAVQVLINRIEGRGAEPAEMVFDCSLDLRSSTAPVPNSV